MVEVIVQHHVADYDTWLPVFEENVTVRRQHGATGHTVYGAVDDPNTLVVVVSFESAEGARAFMSDPALRDAMTRAGVDSAPSILIVEQTDSGTY